LFATLRIIVSGVFFYAGALGFIGGIFARSLLSIDIYALGCIGIVACALWSIGHRRSEASSVPVIVYASIFLLLFCIGAFRMEYATWGELNSIYESQLETEVEVEGVVVREVERRERSSHVYVRVEDELILVFASPHADVSYGDQVHAVGTLTKPKAFETDLGRVFDYQKYLQARGVSYTLSFAEVNVRSKDEGNPLIAALLRFKHAFMERTERIIPQPEAGLGEGLLLGVKQAMGEDLEEAFRTTGITHIVVLSGYNVMLVIVFVTYVLSFILPMRLRLVFGIGAVIAFALLVGLSATVVRASLMASLLLIAQATGRTYAVVRALIVTGLVMLLINPYLLVYDVGFQLSFIATLGLILFAPHIEKYVTFMPKIIGLRSFLTATLATQIFVAPLLLYQIGELSIVSVVVNVLVLPVVPVAMLLTFATGMIAFISLELALIVGWFATWPLTYILAVAQTFSKIPFASFAVPAFPFVMAVIAYGCLALWLWHLHRQTLHALPQLSGWTIIAESELLKQLRTSSVKKLHSPVFFR